MGVGGQRHDPVALPPEKNRYPLYRRLGGPQGRSGWVHKISTLPVFDPLIVQPVASRYTDWENTKTFKSIQGDYKSNDTLYHHRINVDYH